MIRLHLAYEGTRFHGWQAQPGLRTVEGCVKRALAQLWGCPIDAVDVQGASRTDAGVHALGQVVSFDEGERDRTVWDYLRGLNALTPREITVNHAQRIDDFNARHDARGKLYRYRVWNHRWADPLNLDRAWLEWSRLDFDAMDEAARQMVGEFEFDAFRAADCQALTTRRRITRVSMIRPTSTRPEVVFEVEGTAFLKQMVRIMVGTLVDVGRGQLDASSIASIIESRDRSQAGQTAPPQGLTLVRLDYPDHPWDIEPHIGLRAPFDRVEE